MKVPVAGFHLVHCGGRRIGIGDRINELTAAIKKEVGQFRLSLNLHSANTATKTTDAIRVAVLCCPLRRSAKSKLTRGILL